MWNAEDGCWKIYVSLGTWTIHYNAWFAPPVIKKNKQTSEWVYLSNGNWAPRFVHSPGRMQCFLPPLASVGCCTCALRPPKRYELAPKDYSLDLKLYGRMQEEVSEIRSRQCPLWFAETSLSDAPQTLGEGPQAGCWPAWDMTPYGPGVLP